MIQFFRQVCLLFVCTVLPLSLLATESEVFVSPQARVKLISSVARLAPGDKFQLALYFQQSKEWHIYWQNPGDSGLQPEFNWELPDQVLLDSKIHWERPDLIVQEEVVNYGFNRSAVLLPVELQLHDDFSKDRLDVVLHAEWLICKVECVPYQQTFKLSIPVGTATVAANQGYFDKHLKQLPVLVAKSADYQDQDKYLRFIFKELPEIQGRPYLLLSEPSVTQNIEEQSFETSSLGTKLILPKAPENSDLPNILQGLLLDLDQQNKTQAAYQFKFSQISEVAQVNSVDNKGLSLVLAVVFAFIGGIILNLMPCVFPVIAIKILEFCNFSGDHPGKVRKHAYCFSAGIIIFMLFLAILLQLIKLSGEAVGWGFQLQSPVFVSVLFILFYLIGLSFSGFFDIGNSFVNVFAKSWTGSGYLASFANGALATLVATPCTAPFMGAALGATISMGFLKSLFIFFALGLGMSFPYILLALNQRLLGCLPKPGAWMEKLRQFLAFPMYLACLWLLWVLGSQVPLQYIFSLLLSALLLSLAVWLLNNLRQWVWFRRLTVSTLIILAIAPVFFMLSANNELPENAQNAYGLEYSEFTPELIDELKSTGDAIYIDFTARWCLTCQVNKKRVFSSKKVRNFFIKNNVRLVVADWTNQSEQIENALSEFGRNSVPLNVVYCPGEDLPVILPSLLGPETVLDALKCA